MLYFLWFTLLIGGSLISIVPLVLSYSRVNKVKNYMVKQHYKEIIKVSFVFLFTLIYLVFFNIAADSTGGIIFLIILPIILIINIIGYCRIIKGIVQLIREKPFYKI